jgi:hypothetical protein
MFVVMIYLLGICLVWSNGVARRSIRFDPEEAAITGA